MQSRFRTGNRDHFSWQRSSGLTGEVLGGERLVHGGLHNSAEELDRLHYLVVRQRADGKLQAEAVVAEPFVLQEDLVDHLLRGADEVGAVQGGAGVELLARLRRPPALFAD